MRNKAADTKLIRRCPHCGNALRVRRQLLNKRVVCPTCEHGFHVSSSEAGRPNQPPEISRAISSHPNSNLSRPKSTAREYAQRMRRQRKVVINVGVPTAVVVLLAVLAVFIVFGGRGESSGTSNAMDGEPEETTRSLEESNSPNREEPKERPMETEVAELKLFPIKDQKVKVGNRLEVAIRANEEIDGNEIRYTIKEGPSGLHKDAIRSGTLIWQPTQSDVGRHEVLVLAETTSDQPRKSELKLRIDVVAADPEKDQTSPEPVTGPEVVADTSSDVLDENARIKNTKHEITLDLTGETTFYTLENQAPFQNVDDAALILEIARLENFPAKTTFLHNRNRREFGKTVTISLPVKDATISLKLARNKDRDLGIDIRSKADVGNMTLELSQSTLAETRSALNGSIPKNRSDGDVLLKELRELNAQHTYVKYKWTPRNAGQIAAKATRLLNLERKINKQENAIKSNTRRTR